MPKAKALGSLSTTKAIRLPNMVSSKQLIDDRPASYFQSVYKKYKAVREIKFISCVNEKNCERTFKTNNSVSLYLLKYLAYIGLFLCTIFY